MSKTNFIVSLGMLLTIAAIITFSCIHLAV